MITTAPLRHEHDLYAQGFRCVAGLDEAGRGAWAGPVMAGAVILPLDHPDLDCALAGVNDSKLLTPRRRTSLARCIQETALAWAVGSASSAEIDMLGIVSATRLAMRRALDGLAVCADYLLIDALTLPDVSLPQLPLIKGDQRSLSIAAASILAKVTRDAHMTALHARYPAYGFAGHKGYGTPQHRAALDMHGPCPEHRRSFAIVSHQKV